MFLFYIGVAQENSGPFGEALRSYELGTEHAPDFPEAHSNTARIHEELGDAAMPIRHFNAYRNLQKGS